VSRQKSVDDAADKAAVVLAEALGSTAGIELRLDGGPPVRFRLLWHEASETCAAVVAALPKEAECFHAIYSGTVAAFLIDPTVVAPTENATTCVLPGDLLFTHYDSGFRHGHQEPLSEVYWAYDRYARPTVPGQFVPIAANVFGTYDGSVEEWADFADRCRRLCSRGTAVIEIGSF
jgi:hypothetical protein